MKRYSLDLHELELAESSKGTYVKYVDVQVTAIMNFNLLEQIRERDEKIKELEQKVSRRDKLIKDMEERAYDDYCDRQD